MIAAVLAAAALAAPQPQLLVVTETRGFVHDSIPAAKAMVASLGYRTRLLNGARELTAARLRGAGAVVFLNTSGELRLDAAGRRRLLAYVRDGGAFVGAHAAADTFSGWPAFHRMLGADFLGHAPANPSQPTRVDVVDRAFTSARSFAIGDEFYRFRGRAKRHVVMREHGGGALAWWRRYGRGRVFYDALGHFPATWSESHQRQLMADGIRWAVGRGP
jgi:type 1 glutamine amidotransferase